MRSRCRRFLIWIFHYRSAKSFVRPPATLVRIADIMCGMAVLYSNGPPGLSFVGTCFQFAMLSGDGSAHAQPGGPLRAAEMRR